MDNLLPTFQTFHLDKDVKKKREKNRQWDPSSSLPRLNNSLTFIPPNDERKPRPSAATSYGVPNSAPPNKRYLEVKAQAEDSSYVSPLSRSERWAREHTTSHHCPALTVWVLTITSYIFYS